MKDEALAVLSDTPRTDAEYCDGGFVPVDFARQLERELNEATKCKHQSQYMSCANGVIESWCQTCGSALVPEMRDERFGPHVPPTKTKWEAPIFDLDHAAPQAMPKTTANAERLSRLSLGPADAAPNWYPHCHVCECWPCRCH